MAIKELYVEDVGEVRFQKRRGTHSVRLHIQGHKVTVTMPHWISYKYAIEFVRTRQEWIEKHRTDKHILATGALIGKQYELKISHDDCSKPSTRILKGLIRVNLPAGQAVDGDGMQELIARACERALTKEAQNLLTPRIHDLAYEFGFTYNSLHFKKLQRRWGSCDNKKHIILNIFLTQLPWEYIDYVLLHELTHTEHLHHGPEFWARLDTCIPDAKKIRKELQQFHPQLMPH